MKWDTALLDDIRDMMAHFERGAARRWWMSFMDPSHGRVQEIRRRMFVQSRFKVETLRREARRRMDQTRYVETTPSKAYRNAWKEVLDFLNQEGF